LFSPFFAALQFLTIAPPLVKREFTERELGQAAGFYPLVGALIGALLYAANYGLAQLFPDVLRAALLLTLWVLVTGALHLDGFLDACDGILGGLSPERRMEIMRDERVGAFGLAGGVLLLLMKFAALSTLPLPAPQLVLVPLFSRWGMTLAVFAFPYARPQGLGQIIKAHTTWQDFLLASLTAAAIAWLAAQWTGLAALLASALIVWSTARFTLRRIPGLTGDVYGAINELIEVVLLIALSIIHA